MSWSVSCSSPAALREDEESLATRHSLLSRLRDLSDEASWRTFFETYGRLLYNFARKNGLSDQEAQDVVQETVIAVARKMPEFHYNPAKGSFKQWLLLITRRRVQDHLRKLYRSLPSADSVIAGCQHVEAMCPELTADDAMAAAWELEWQESIFRAALHQARQRVQPKTYQAFDYLVLQEMPARQVAEMLGLNVAQVYLAKHRVGHAVKRAARELGRGVGA
jgi:RNA polymerase sigma factor (sigma-70 family)